MSASLLACLDVGGCHLQEGKVIAESAGRNTRSLCQDSGMAIGELRQHVSARGSDDAQAALVCQDCL